MVYWRMEVTIARNTKTVCVTRVEYLHDVWSVDTDPKSRPESRVVVPCAPPLRYAILVEEVIAELFMSYSVAQAAEGLTACDLQGP